MTCSEQSLGIRRPVAGTGSCSSSKASCTKAPKKVYEARIAPAVDCRLHAHDEATV